jgi:hypothetical protein
MVVVKKAVLIFVLDILFTVAPFSLAIASESDMGPSPVNVVLGGTLLVGEGSGHHCQAASFLGRQARFLKPPAHWSWSKDPGNRRVSLLGVDFADQPGMHTLRFIGCPGVSPRSILVVNRHFMTSRLHVKKSFVHPPKSFFDRIRRESREIHQGLSERTGLAFQKPFVMPITGRITHDFGAIRILNGTPLSRHSGEDIDGPEGLPVKAANSGRVVIAGRFYYDGNMVIIDHGGGLFTEYLHLSRIRVKKGQSVQQGEVVGSLGHTGRVTGPVLHYGAVLGNAHVNPLLLSKFPVAVLEIP